jgi:cytochrome oxidase Cu insertion factor (SCO1/SenC/PrrC family)
MGMQTESVGGLRRARLKLTLMLVTPMLVVLLASVVFYTGIGIPRGTTNKGLLVQPPRQIDELALHSADGQPWRYADDHRGWGILVAVGTTCDDDCRARILLTRQVRAALGKDVDRVQRYLLRTGDGADTGLDAFLADGQADLLELRADSAALRALLGASDLPDPAGAGTIYIVDPRGFVMMRYLPSHPDRALLDDLRFLLRNSPG